MKANTREFAKSGPTLGLNERLDMFRRQLASSNLKVRRDKDIVPLIFRYAKNVKGVKSELKYLRGVRVNGLEWCQSIKQANQLIEQLEAFSKPSHANFGWCDNYQESLKAMKKDFSEWHLTPQIFNSIEEMRKSLPKEDTHSGYLSFVTGKKEKGNNLEEMFSYYGEAWQAIRQGNRIASFPILPSYRTQGSGVYDSDGCRTPQSAKLKTRLVSMVDARIIGLELSFARPFQERMASYQRYAGGKNDNQIHTLIYDKAHYHNRWISLDYSRYDQSVSDWLIRDAFDVLRAAFDLDTYESRMLDEVVRIFIHKDFVSPNGYMHSDKGVPSGSMFTQIIDSIVNELMIRTVMRALNIKEYDMLIMGDDNLLFYNCSEPKGVDISSYLTHNFGVTVNAAKLSSGLCEDANFEFLSKFWLRQGAYRNPNILLSKLVYPERFRDYRDGDATPEEVLYDYCLAYPVGMKDLIDVEEFERDFRQRRKLKSRVAGFSGYVPGYLQYQWDYLGVGEEYYY